MHPSSSVMPPSLAFDDPKPRRSRGKRAVQVIMCLTHYTVALLLLSSMILGMVSNRRTLFLLYTLPLVLVLLIVETYHLCNKRVPKRISEKLGPFTRLRFRSFAYQAAAALDIVFASPPFPSQCYNRNGVTHCFNIHDSLIEAVFAISWTVWAIGVSLFILAIISSECGFEGWVEDPEEGDEERNIQLSDSDSEIGDLVGSTPVGSV